MRATTCWKYGSVFVEEMDEEWHRLAEGAESGADVESILDDLRRTEQFAGVHNLYDVLDRIKMLDRVGCVDPAFAVLIQLAQSGRRLAARIILQTMVGGIVKRAGLLAHQHSPQRVPERMFCYEIAASMWERIHRYRLDKRSGKKIPANLLLDSLKSVRANWASESPIGRPVEDVETAIDGTQRDWTDPADVVWDVLSEAVARGLIRDWEADYYAQVCEYPSLDDAADAFGQSPAMVRQRISRMRRQIVAGMRSEVTAAA